MHASVEDHTIPNLNEGLLDASSLLPNSSRHTDFWSIDHPSVFQLQQLFLEAATVLYQKYCQINNRTPFAIQTTRGWMNTLGPNQWTSPHSHPGSLFAGVYYVSAPHNSGDLLLQDPSAGTEYVNHTDSNRDCRVYQRIPATTGRLIVFPGHLVHCTEPNLSQQQRICVATNFCVED